MNGRVIFIFFADRLILQGLDLFGGESETFFLKYLFVFFCSSPNRFASAEEPQNGTYRSTQAAIGAPNQFTGPPIPEKTKNGRPRVV